MSSGCYFDFWLKGPGVTDNFGDIRRRNKLVTRVHWIHIILTYTSFGKHAHWTWRKCTKERIRRTFVILGSEKTSFEEVYSWVSIIYQASDMGQADPSSDLSRRQETMGRRLEKNKLHCWQETRKWSLIWLLLSPSFCRHHTSLPRPVRNGRDGKIYFHHRQK